MPGEIIVVGTGMGGGAAGYELARAGMRVHFLEMGPSPELLDPRYSGHFAENVVLGDRRKRDEVYRRSSRAIYHVNGSTPVLGSGLGGSTAVYGAGLVPFSRRDFRGWPISYETIKPYYDRCDRLFRPAGTQDPLGDDARDLVQPPDLQPAQREWFEFMRIRGLSPFRLPIAMERTADCRQCVGSFCSRFCKKTAGNVFVQPAVDCSGARITYEVTVESLLMEGARCVGVVGRTPRGRQTFHGDTVFLAAGALQTPVVLLNSRTQEFPRGVGNGSDLVGRHLMRHLIDFYFVKTGAGAGRDQRVMDLACSDIADCFLNAGGSFMAPDVMAAEFIGRKLPNAPHWLRRPAIAVVRRHLRRIISDRLSVVAIMEDEASYDNRVLPSSQPDRIDIRYRISAHDRRRIAQVRRTLGELFAPLDGTSLRGAEDDSFLAHACGTCRMGRSQDDSVVAADGRVHGTGNLFVADASLFVTSAAVNPSFTIAACGLRIGREFVLRSGSSQELATRTNPRQFRPEFGVFT